MTRSTVASICLCLSAPTHVAAFPRVPVFRSNESLARNNHPWRLFTKRRICLSATEKERKMSQLDEWASTGGVCFADNVSMTNNGADDWGISLCKSKKAGDVVLSVPKLLTLSSRQILEEFGDETLQPAIQILESLNVNQYLPEFLLFLKILTEKAIGKSSTWYPWLQSLPTTFDTGIYMDSIERSCLPKLGLALAEYEDEKLVAFEKAVRAVQSTVPELENLLALQDVDYIFKWAFNVVLSRCWRFSSDVGPDAEADIVPLGDMFNHREPADVIVQDVPDSDVVKFVLAHDVDVATGESKSLHLSYGLNNPYRFLIIFGFVDETMPEVFSQVIFTDPNPELIDLGCNDRSKMVFRTQDGAVANAVWDTVLYALLESRPEERKALYNAHQQDDKEAKAAIHAKYALEAAFHLRKHVEELQSNLNSIGDEWYCGDKQMIKEHERLSLICRHNNFLRSVFQKVKTRLDEMVDAESRKRMTKRAQSAT